MTIQQIEQFLAQKKIGIVGISRNEQKFSNQVFKKLKETEYNVYPVHPEMDSFDGDKCVTSILQLPDDVQTLMIIAGPDVCASVLKDITTPNITRIWLFSGTSTRPDIAAEIQRLEDTGVSIISGTCPFMFLEPVTSVHAIHRFFARLFGKYPKDEGIGSRE